jgi:hypothetical protein
MFTFTETVERYCRIAEARITRKVLLGERRFAALILVILAIMMTAPTWSATGVNRTVLQSNCFTAPDIDLAFIIDKSGSLANRIDTAEGSEERGRGQTYNAVIEGIIRALLDKTIIPRDEKIAISVLTFSDTAEIKVALTIIASDEIAITTASEVKMLMCPTIDESQSVTSTCPAGKTNYTNAILTANNYLNQNRREGARRVLLMVTDGEPKDLDMAIDARVEVLNDAARQNIQSELDVILVGLDGSEVAESKTNVEKIVFSQPENPLRGKILEVESGNCNIPGQSSFIADCDKQADKFAEHVRDILRSDVKSLNLKVTTEGDVAPNTPLPDGAVPLVPTLRQAIEAANCNGGSTTITFVDTVRGKTIRPLVPLPALTAPDIRIDGCEGNQCDDSVTIDGKNTDTEQGERHSDGILIRSNRDVVRRLKIINFKRAGIAIAPLSSTDNVCKNLIEKNALEKNAKAGVMVLDLEPPGGESTLVAIGIAPRGGNVGNTISCNDIEGSETLIDLDGDGKKDNDMDDVDVGPNTLINFPDPFIITKTGNTVTATGLAAPGAKVEIFAVTSFRKEAEGRFINGVKCLAEAICNDRGEFTATGIPDSPTCSYTATATDTAGNTSELRCLCEGLAKAALDKSDIKFSEAKPNQNALFASFNIENVGCAPLHLTSYSVKRTGADVDNGRIRTEKDGDDDSFHFSIQKPTARNKKRNKKSPIFFDPAITIDPGKSQDLIVSFNPVIPPVSTIKPPAVDTLPHDITSRLTINHDGCGDSSVNLNASVTTQIHLINPKRDEPRTPPLVTLKRSGDIFTVTFSVFDSNKDVVNATYEFFNKAGGVVPCGNCNCDPKDPTCNLKGIQGKYVAGQSFTVTQNFSNALKNLEATSVAVTVFDEQGSSDTARVGQTVIANKSAARRASRRKQVRGLILSSLKALPATGNHSQHAKKKMEP